MAVSYNGLWKLLIDKNMKKMDLVERIGISTSTLAKMSKGEGLKESICREAVYPVETEICFGQKELCL